MMNSRHKHPHMKKFIFIAIIIAAAALFTQAQTTRKLTAAKSGEYGLIYRLPLTQFNVTIEAERTVSIPGEFYRYARKHLGIDPITERAEQWTIKSVTIVPAGFPDTEEEYLVQFKSGSTPFMVIDNNNFPLTVNNEEYTPAPLPVLPVAKAAEPTVLETPAARQAMTEEMLQSKSTAKRAELAAAKIFELRQSRNDIISGQADNMPADGRAMQLALDNLTAQESALTAMFAGTTSTSTEVATFTYMPTADDLTDKEQLRTIVARLSQTDGIVDSDNLSGAPIYLDIKVLQRGEQPVTEKGEEKKFPKGGLAYRIPGKARVSISYDGRTLATKDVEMAQLGIVFGIDPAIFTDKKAPGYVNFSPISGSIIEIGTLR